MRSVALFALAALFEIAGCFAFWLWLKRSAEPWVVAAGLASLIAFAVTLAQSEIAFAGRAYAAYGGVYILASLLWLWRVEGQRPTPTDLVGAGLALTGALVIVIWARR